MRMRTYIERLQRRLRGEQMGADEGFSLAELIVVVAIIAILAAVAVPVYMNQQDRARTNGAISELRAAKTAVAAFLAENDGTAPTNFNAAQLDEYGVPLNRPTGSGAAIIGLTIAQTAASVAGGDLDYDFVGQAANGLSCSATMRTEPTCS